ncbi:MAG: hypothetical protein CL946_06020 [Ectothiorhodospiraceae bacterium]|nr:hypothetical protein [Ectothiorhodospiraceae bacterium]
MSESPNPEEIQRTEKKKTPIASIAFLGLIIIIAWYWFIFMNNPNNGSGSVDAAEQVELLDEIRLDAD